MSDTATAFVPDEPDFAEVENAKPFADKFEYLGVFDGMPLWLLRERIEAGPDDRWFTPYRPGLYRWYDDEGGCWSRLGLEGDDRDYVERRRANREKAAELATRTAPLNADSFGTLAPAIFKFLHIEEEQANHG